MLNRSRLKAPDAGEESGPARGRRRTRAGRPSVDSAETWRRLLADAGTLLASTLDLEATLANVARIAVPTLADWCLVHLVEGERSPRRVAIAYRNPDQAALAQRIEVRPPTPNRSHPVALAIRRGRPHLVPVVRPELLARIAHDPDHLADLRAIGPRSSLAVPLIARGQTLGAIHFLTAESGRRYGPDDVALAQDLADRAALAVDNARLYVAEQRARRVAEQTVDRMARLQAVMVALAEALTPDQVAGVIVDEGAAALGAAGALVALQDDAAGAAEIIRAVGYPADLIAAGCRVSLDLDSPIADVIRTGQPIWIECPDQASGRYPALESVRERIGHQTWAVVPLPVEGRTIGALDFSFAEARAFTPDDRGFILALAQQCAQAFERARLFAETRAAQAALDLALAAAEAERARLRQVLDVLPEGIRIIDRDGRVLMNNAAADEILEAETADQTLPSIDDETQALDRLRRPDGTPYQADELPLWRSIRWGEVIRGEQIVYSSRRLNRDVLLLLSCAPLRDAAGVIVGGVAAFQDITSIKEVERARDDFLSSVSHDLKAPLTTIRGLAQLCLRYPDHDQLASRLEGIVAATTRMTTLIGELLDVARLRLGQPLELDRRSADLVAIVRQVIADQQSTTERHELRLETAAPEIFGIWDAARLERVVTNLVSNAIKYSPAGGPIAIRLGPDPATPGDWVSFSISDPGVGIPEADLPYIFDRFRRAGNVAGHIAGTGVGLASARQIIDQHGGTIEVTSVEGQGSTFTVRLPRLLLGTRPAGSGDGPPAPPGGPSFKPSRET